MYENVLSPKDESCIHYCELADKPIRISEPAAVCLLLPPSEAHEDQVGVGGLTETIDSCIHLSMFLNWTQPPLSALLQEQDQTRVRQVTHSNHLLVLLFQTVKCNMCSTYERRFGFCSAASRLRANGLLSKFGS